MSNDPSQTRKVVPYKPSKRVSTFRKLDVDFAGTAIEQALAMQQNQANQLISNTEASKNISEISEISEPINQPQANISLENPNSINHDLEQKPDLRSIQNDQSHFVDTSIQQTLVSDSTVIHQIPVSIKDQSLIDTSIKQTVIAPLSKYTEPDKNYFKVPNFVGDELLSLLDPYEFKVYFRLFRLSYGFHQSQCFVGYKSLSEACNLSIAQLKRVIPSLIKKGVIRVIQYFNNANKKGTVYEIYTSVNQIPVSNSDQSPSETSIQQSSTSYDQEDLNNKSSSKEALMLSDDDIFKSNHFLETKTAYELITKNSFKLSDMKTYKEIKQIPLDIIQEAFKVVSSRSNSRPNSLKYFVKEILQLANPNFVARVQKKKLLEKVVKSIRSSYIGTSLPISELAAKTKDACARDGIAFDNDLFNSIISNK